MVNLTDHKCLKWCRLSTKTENLAELPNFDEADWTSTTQIPSYLLKMILGLVRAYHLDQQNNISTPTGVGKSTWDWQLQSKTDTKK